MDKFDTDLLSKIVEISNENKTISVQCDINDTSDQGGYCNCYGSIIISSMLNGSYIWKFKNLSKTKSPMIYIGIVNADQVSIDGMITHREVSEWYVLHPLGIAKSYPVESRNSGYTRRKCNCTKYCYQGSILNMRLTEGWEISEREISG